MSAVNGRMKTAASFAVAMMLIATLVPETAVAALGRSAAAFAVSDGGEAQYTIPIFSLPGANRLAPKIALSYGHRSGGSLFGVGWDLSGLSEITVCPKTWAQDGQSRAVRLDGTDRFCLAGMQLKLEGSGPYGANGVQYRTEIESYARITSWGVTGNTPSYFTVEQKDGLILDYGSRSDSRIESVGSSTAHTWALTTIRDRSGNRIEFYYTEDATNGSFRPSSITWTSNPTLGISAGYTMAFVYATQPAGEVEVGYAAGGVVRDISRATEINISHGGTLVRRYSLAYEANLSSAKKSRLASVTECAGATGNDCLPPTTFTYQNGTPGFGSQAATGFS